MDRQPAHALSTRPARAPGPPRSATLGLVRRLKSDRIRFFAELWREYGDIVRIPLGHRTLFLVVDPHALEHILRANHKNYEKSSLFNTERRRGLGDSLLTNGGEAWRRQRKLVQPAFSKQMLDIYVEDIVRVSARELERLEPIAAAGEPYNIAEFLTDLTIHVASRTLFGTELGYDTSRIRHDVEVLVQIASERMASLVRLPMFLPLARHRTFRRTLADLDELVYGTIRQRRGDGAEGVDVLSRMLAARGEGGDGLSDKQLRDEVMTFLIAGHESTASGLAWMVYLLGCHPEVEERMRREIAEVLGDRDPGPGDLERLVYSRQVVEESLRLYPPSWLFDRAARSDDTLGGYRVPRGSHIMILPYLTHRHPNYWPDPERFDPDRFAPGREKDRPAFAYCPFSGGPRQCIGNRFAVIESTLVLAMLLRRFSFTLEPDQPIELHTLIALRPRYGIKLRLGAAPTQDRRQGGRLEA